MGAQLKPVATVDLLQGAFVALLKLGDELAVILPGHQVRILQTPPGVSQGIRANFSAGFGATLADDRWWSADGNRFFAAWPCSWPFW